ncbi:MAG: TonB-dependent receptor [Methylococcaceae bacterium]|nr:TonB-dependent receptor [Methylococcaceae bacterium]
MFASPRVPITVPTAAALGLIAWSGLQPMAADDLPRAPELPDMNLEQLMGMEITSAGKKSQKLSNTAAAVYVITQEEIRRSGVTSIPEALRLAPGIEVARIDANKWAITARGFNGRFANKLLVLMDGRSVYTPTFAGAYWDVQDTVLDDIDRIEVIRGPGATVWGANAVNGVINIITRSADKTRGGSIGFGAGNQERAVGHVRYGFQLDGKTQGRIYFKGFGRERFHIDDPADRGGSDAWNMQRGGFRLDRDDKSGDVLTLQGDLYAGKLREIWGLGGPPPTPSHVHDRPNVAGWNLLGRWKKALRVDSDFTLQFFYDHTERREAYLDQIDDTLDLDFQHHFAWGERQDFVWGLGYRWIGDRLNDTAIFRWSDRSRNLQLFSGFLQDEISLVPEQLRLSLGSKLEHNDFTGFVVQPSVRLSWTPSSRHTLWGAISRAVRTPSRAEQDGRFYTLAPLPPGDSNNPTPFPVYFSAVGQPGFRAEDVVSFELGHRFMPSPSLSLDAAAFYNVYNRLRSFRGSTPVLFGSGYLEQPAYFVNEMRGNTYGAELVVKWLPMSWWSLEAQYSFLGMDLRAHPGRFENAGAVENVAPKQQWSLRSSFDLPHDFELDLRLRYMDRIVAGLTLPGYQTAIPDYLTLDARLAWRPRPSVELSLVGQNLLDNHHPEFYQESFQGAQSEVPRSYYLKASWQF